MMPGQGQTQVSTKILIGLLKQDINTIGGKVQYLRLRRDGIKAVENNKPVDLQAMSLLRNPGVADIFLSFRLQTQIDLDLAERQLHTLEERLKQVRSNIILPGGPNNFPQAS